MNKKVVVIHQPDFLPYLGFFDRLRDADLFILLDTAQFVDGTSRAWTHRDRIKTAAGEKWLTLAVQKHPHGTSIRDIRLAEGDWRQRNLALIRENYRHAPFFAEIWPQLQALYATPGERLLDLNLAALTFAMAALGLEVPLRFASTLDAGGKKNELLANLLRQVEATHYLSGPGARAYFEPGPFQAAGVEVVWQDFHHPVYPQQFGPFLPNLSCIDLLLNCGTERSRHILRGTV